ncbi:hypothetical protein KUL118_01550 [Tenacibaculum sp. KUL118]|nr:hypothetical protein KUL118_01550 [Tenacibaculum sp. KUL118]
MKFNNVSVYFGWPKPVVVLQYGTLQYEIGTLELKGVTLLQLGNLDPERVAKHHQMLLVCEMSTTIRLAKTDIPEPVNTCSRKLFDVTCAEPLKVTHKTNLRA